jgi:IS30 family transposase
MGRVYRQLSLEERCEISRLQAAGSSIQQIAAALDRSPSSISRELKRNKGSGPRAGPYQPAYAQQQTVARRWSGSRLERDETLRDQVLEGLKKGWSPEQVSGRLKLEQRRPVIGHESIYRFIYSQLKRSNDGAWRFYLPRAKARRGRRGRKGGSPASFIQQRVGVAERPPEALTRDRPGHWEADFMLFAAYGQSVLVLHERTSRLTALVKTTSRKASPTATTLGGLLGPLPDSLKQSLTFDNGTEFAEHYRVGLDTYFCDPHAPWQKGGVENAIGRIRRFLPRKTDLQTVSDQQIIAVAQTYNHTPRQCLDFRTPAEVFSRVLHFERESTSRPSPGGAVLSTQPWPAQAFGNGRLTNREPASPNRHGTSMALLMPMRGPVTTPAASPGIRSKGGSSTRRPLC